MFPNITPIFSTLHNIPQPSLPLSTNHAPNPLPTNHAPNPLPTNHAPNPLRQDAPQQIGAEVAVEKRAQHEPLRRLVPVKLLVGRRLFLQQFNKTSNIKRFIYQILYEKINL